MRPAQAEVAWAKLGIAANRLAEVELKAAQEMLEVREARAVAIKDARRAGMSLREIGSQMGISPARVQQIANDF
jgi:DNA-directed RNA polymerase specialized sigma subunit